MGGGLPEYWLVFRKPQTDKSAGYADVPVTKDKSDYTRRHWQIDASNYWRSSGNRLLTPEELADMAQLRQVYRWYANYSREAVYDYHAHAEMGSVLEERGRLPASFMLFNPAAPDAFADTVWSVHDYVRMRSLNGAQSHSREENHTCPLPLDLIERMIRRYSNEGELVFDPFGGLSSVPYMAVKMNRRGYSVELNSDYWRAGVKYCQGVEMQKKAPTLFDMLDIEPAPIDEDGIEIPEENLMAAD
jgi:DNA modification methylase